MSTLLSRNIWNVDIEIAFGWHLTCCFSQLSNAACVFCICFQWQGCEPSLATHCHLSRLAGQRVRAIITKSKVFNFFFFNTNEDRVTNHHQDPHNHLSADGFHPRRERGARRQRGQPEHLQRIRSFQGV